MNYFNQFPLIQYDFDGVSHVLTDIFRRSRLNPIYEDLTDMYTTYSVNDGETPEDVSMRFYKTPDLHWVILVINKIINPYTDWVQPEHVIEEIAKEKYGDDYQKTWYYEDSDGDVVSVIKEYKKGAVWTSPTDTGNHLAVTFLDHELRLNEKRREIKILRVELVTDFISEYIRTIRR